MAYKNDLGCANKAFEETSLAKAWRCNNQVSIVCLCVCVCACVCAHAFSHLVVSDPLRPQGLQLRFSMASLVAQTVKNLPARWETRV